ncbi:hypothetical protein BGW38_005002 [Lunasporangiospora selenospora]|uniref:BHLH domain-containing protein n=1 Tax=Lunasporangiospora selenospora TaxID=979761 RepID=A0A9P6KB62_9FUNG|nr:hypothetical protein BGW38_005002 [Lunasporangiospora selenospora]
MPATLNGMPFSSRRASSDHSVSSTSSSFSSPATLTTSTTSSLFQPQSLPVIFQNQVAGSGSNGNHNNGSNPLQLFATALGQQLQRQQQQQQQQSGAYNHVAPLTPALSASMPVHSTTHQPFPSFRPVSSPDLLPTLLRPDISSPFSQPTVYPLPSTSATAIAVDNKQEDKLKSKSSNTLVLPPPRALPPRPPQTSAPRRYLGRQMRKQPPSAKMLLSNPAKEPAVPSRRMAHIISEQKRREKINGGFDELKSVIPECAENTDSKATILRKAVDYILLLEDELRRYSECYQAEDEEFDETLATYKEEEEDEVYVQ